MILSMVNQKGGVGKTTSTVSLTAALTQLGKKVLLCDFDPQANATSGLGVEKSQVKSTVYDVIINGTPAKDAIIHTKFGDLLASGADLAGAGIELVSLDRREFRLKDALAPLKSEYDFIFIDCPPSLELLTLNALCAADQVMIPVQCEYYALEGLSDLMTTLRAVKKTYQPTIDIFGLILTMYDGRTNLSIQVAQEVRRHFPGKVFAAVIPRNVRLSEAPSHGLPITVYDKTSRGAEAYLNLAQEMLKKSNQ
jgi:chromosome partitioning protein